MRDGKVAIIFKRLVPNCIMKAKNERRKQYIGSQIDDCKDLSGIFYLLPFQKGYLVNWDVQRQVWEHTFGKDVMNLEPEDTNAIIAEPYFDFSSIQEAMNEIYFEEYNFKAILRTNAGTLSAFKNRQEEPNQLCCLLVDCGYSFTHIAPYYNGKKVGSAIRRVNIGGKVLTNHLKEIISYRQLHVMDETYVMNQVKEDVCYVSLDFFGDMKIAKLKGQENTIVRDYILPDFSHSKRGYLKQDDTKLKPHEQTVRMNNERFAVPEILFHPSDIGIQEMGVSEAIVHVINNCPTDMRPHLFKNILLTGGNAMFPGFKERVESDVRSMAPALYDVRVTKPVNPITHAWEGGKLLSTSKNFSSLMVTRDEYNEHGHSICWEKFDV
ncbi:actin-related protein 6-like [Patiria miniata]|uniref:Actin-related protein 6 n=1 Tax=Patiria miniata TaxID=46514 RepID=A0A913Z780_PATMI|nr:actin-related protein 6-like [Patiria miniata]